MSSEEGQYKVRHKDSKAGKEEKEKSWDREGKKEREATSKSKKVVPDMKSFFQFTAVGSLKPYRCSVPCRTPRIHATSRPTSCPFSASRRHTPLSVSFLCSHPFHNCRATVKSPGLQLNQKHSLSPGVSGSAQCWTLFSLLSAQEGTAERVNTQPQKELQKGRRRLEGMVRTVSWCP